MGKRRAGPSLQGTCPAPTLPSEPKVFKTRKSHQFFVTSIMLVAFPIQPFRKQLNREKEGKKKLKGKRQDFISTRRAEGRSGHHAALRRGSGGGSRTWCCSSSCTSTCGDTQSGQRDRWRAQPRAPFPSSRPPHALTRSVPRHGPVLRKRAMRK